MPEFGAERGSLATVSRVAGIDVCIPATIISSEKAEGEGGPFPHAHHCCPGAVLAPTLPISPTTLHKGAASLSPPLPCSPISRRLTKEVAAGLGGGGRQRDTTGQFLSRGGGLPSGGALCPSAITGTCGRPAARAPEWKAARGSLGKTPHCHRSNL